MALPVVLSSMAMFGGTRETDVGPAGHIWQLLMPGQLPVLLFFAIKMAATCSEADAVWYSRQAGAVLAAIAPVFFLGL
jgi:hypothetical protein